MKKYILVIALGLFCFSVNAQSLTLNNFVPVHSADVTSTGANIEATVYVENHGSSNIDLMVERVINNMAPNHENYFCFGINCYTPSVSISPSPESIAPGETNTTFKSTVSSTQNAVGTSNVKYCFYDNANISDSVCVGITYVFTVTGIEDVDKNASFSRPSPNPAKSFTAFTYDLKNNTQNFSIKVYNMLGSEVKQIELQDKQGVLVMSTEELENGVYFCSLVSDGKSYLTQKLLVSR